MKLKNVKVGMWVQVKDVVGGSFDSHNIGKFGVVSIIEDNQIYVTMMNGDWDCGYAKDLKKAEVHDFKVVLTGSAPSHEVLNVLMGSLGFTVQSVEGEV